MNVRNDNANILHSNDAKTHKLYSSVPVNNGNRNDIKNSR